MKILTLNTHSWREDNQQYKLEHLAQVIKEKDYDIVALQEVNQSTECPLIDKTGLKADNFMLSLQQELERIDGPRYYGYWDIAKVVRHEFDEGVAILCKAPIIEQECFTVSKSHDRHEIKARRIVRVTIKHEEELVDLYSCHLGWWHDEIEPFEYQCNQLISKLNPNRLTILMGDFNNNANLREEGYDYLLEQGLWDTYTLAEAKDEGATVQGEISGWKGNKVDLRIDLILVNRPIQVKSSAVIFNGRHKEVVSDHYGVEVELF